MIVTNKVETERGRQYRPVLCFVSAILLSMISYPALSVPTGAELKDACAEALVSDFDGLNGQMCTWYVLPCNCTSNKDIPLVCLPEGVAVTDLATEVISGMADYPDLESWPAANAAAEILSRHYPCPA